MKWREVTLALGLVAVLGVVAILFIGTPVSTVFEWKGGAIGIPNAGADSHHGYWDRPDGATPVPTPDPSAAALSVPLRGRPPRHPARSHGHLHPARG